MNIRLRISIDIGRAAHWQLRAGLSWFDPGLSCGKVDSVYDRFVTSQGL